MQTRMPTASKLFAAFAFSAVAFFAAEMIKPHMPPGTQFGAFTQISALIGLVIGWRTLGPDAGRGNYMTSTAGVKAAAFLVLTGLLAFSGERMLTNAFRKAYDGPMNALVDVVKISLDYGRVLLEPDVFTVILLGGILAGLLTEWAARRWN